MRWGKANPAETWKRFFLTQNIINQWCPKKRNQYFYKWEDHAARRNCCSGHFIFHLLIQCKLWAFRLIFSAFASRTFPHFGILITFSSQLSNSSVWPLADAVRQGLLASSSPWITKPHIHQQSPLPDLCKTVALIYPASCSTQGKKNTHLGTVTKLRQTAAWWSLLNVVFVKCLMCTSTNACMKVHKDGTTLGDTQSNDKDRHMMKKSVVP